MLKQETVQYLENRLGNSQLFEELIKQLEKDFQLSVSSDVVFSAKTADDLVSETQLLLENIADTAPAKFSNLLYRIDVPEAEVHQLKESDLTAYLQQMTFLILKREFQKVYIRNTL